MSLQKAAQAVASVWIVEDDAAMLHGVLSLMRAHGIEALGFVDPREALDAALRRPPRVLLTDHVMPYMSGVELARALRDRLQSDCPRIFLVTGSGEPRRAELRLFDHVVRKPFQFARLLPKLVSVLGSRELRRPQLRARNPRGEGL